MKSKKINPDDRVYTKDAKKAYAATEKSVQPVAKDTNKTRRKNTKERLVGVTAKKVKPVSNLKKDMRKKM